MPMPALNVCIRYYVILLFRHTYRDIDKIKRWFHPPCSVWQTSKLKLIPKKEEKITVTDVEA